MARDMPRFDDRIVKEQLRKMNSMSLSVKKLEKSRMGENKDVRQLMSTTSKVIAKMASATTAMTTGIKSVTKGTTKYTKDAIKQYGQALQQDIQLEPAKLSVLASAGGPVVGFFITKLFQTPAFKDAMSTLKDKMTSAMSSAGEKFKKLISASAGGFRNLFRRATGRKPKELEAKKFNLRDVNSEMFTEKDGDIVYNSRGKKIPKLQEGGVIGRGGLARLHPAEVVMPLDKFSNVISEGYKQNREETYREYEEPFYKKFLKGLFDVKVALVKQPSRLRMRLRAMWEGLLERHPVFRGFVRMGEFFIMRPLRFLFAPRGGLYHRYVSKDPNPLVATAKTIGAFYPLMTWKQDQMIQLLTLSLKAQRDTSSAITGKKYSGVDLVKFGRRSIAHRIAEKVGPVFKKFGRFILNSIFSLLTTLLTSKLGLIVGAGIVYATKRKAIKKWFDDLGKITTELVDKIDKFILDVGNKMLDAYYKIKKDYFDPIWEKLLGFYDKNIKPIVDSIAAAGRAVFDSLSKKFMSEFEEVKSAFKEQIADFKKFWGGIYDKLMDIPWVNNMVTKIESLITTIGGYKDAFVIRMKPIFDTLLEIVTILKKPWTIATKASRRVEEKITEEILGLGKEFPGGRQVHEAYWKSKREKLRREEEERTGMYRPPSDIKAEQKLMDILLRRVYRDTVTPAAYREITSGGPENLTNRLVSMRNEKQIVTVDGIMMTFEESLDARLLKLYKKKMEEGRKAKGAVKEMYEGQKGLLKEFYGPAIEKTKQKLEGLLTEQQKELVKEYKEVAVSKVDLVKIMAQEKGYELLAKAESDERLRKGLDVVTKGQGHVLTTVNNATNVINETISNSVNTGAQTFRNIGLDLDPAITDIILGVLD